MRLLVTLCIIISIVSCQNNFEPSTSKEAKTDKKDSIIESKNLKSPKSYLPVGEWQLTKIDFSWGIEQTKNSSELWTFEKDEFIQIKRNDSIIMDSTYFYRKDKSVWSSDTVYLINLNDTRYLNSGELEISMTDSIMILREQCDDCSTYYFIRTM